MTKQQHIDWAVKHPGPSDRKPRFEQRSIRFYGDVAIANGIVSKHSYRTIFTDVFPHRNRRWQAVNAQENAVIH